MPVYLTPERERALQETLGIEEIWKGPIKVGDEVFESPEHYWVMYRHWPKTYIKLDSEGKEIVETES